MAEPNSPIEKRRTFTFTRKRLLVVALLAFLAGALFFGGFMTVLEATNRTEFCVSCHSMQTNFEEFMETPHYLGRVGATVGCADCHVPKPFFPKMKAKILAAKDIYHEIIGTIDTPEKYEAHRWDMASRVWAKMKASNSRECRNCHAFERMDLSLQGRSARSKHEKALDEGQTCIDCHTGIAHEEPLEPDEPAAAGN